MQRWTRLPRGTLLAGAGVFGLALLVRLPFLSWPISPDEGGYALASQWWARGVTLYSDDLWFDRPQGIFLAYRLGIGLIGDSVEAIRLWGALWFAIGAVAIAELTRVLASNRAAILAGVFCALASASPYVEGFTANAEAFMVPMATLSALFIWRRQAVLAGLCAGVAIQLKPSGAAAFALAVYWLVENRSHLGEWTRFGVATAIPIGLGIVHGAATVGLLPYLDAAILFRLQHPVDQPLLRFAWGVQNTALLTAPLVLGAAWGAAVLKGRPRRFVLAFAVTSAGGVAMGGNWWPHYFAQLVPPLAIAFGVGLDSAIRARRRLPMVAAAVASAVVVVGLSHFALLGARDGSATLYNRRGPEIEREFGEFIRANSTPGDRIYVAFTEPGINYYADRLSTVPWLYIQQLAEIEGAYERVLTSVASAEPAFLVVMKDRPPLAENVAAVVTAMGDRYDLVIAHEAADLYRRR